jgi:hypothetical protein
VAYKESAGVTRAHLKRLAVEQLAGVVPMKSVQAVGQGALVLHTRHGEVAAAAEGGVGGGRDAFGGGGGGGGEGEGAKERRGGGLKHGGHKGSRCGGKASHAAAI